MNPTMQIQLWMRTAARSQVVSTFAVLSLVFILLVASVSRGADVEQSLGATGFTSLPSTGTSANDPGASGQNGGTGTSTDTGDGSVDSGTAAPTDGTSGELDASTGLTTFDPSAGDTGGSTGTGDTSTGTGEFAFKSTLIQV